MKDKLKTVKLTERQWDHVLISMENTVQSFVHSINASDKNNLDVSGSRRALVRNNDIAGAIAGQLDWQMKERMSSTWKMVASVIETDSDGDSPK